MNIDSKFFPNQEREKLKPMQFSASCRILNWVVHKVIFCTILVPKTMILNKMLKIEWCTFKFHKIEWCTCTTGTTSNGGAEKLLQNHNYVILWPKLKLVRKKAKIVWQDRWINVLTKSRVYIQQTCRFIYKFEFQKWHFTCTQGFLRMIYFSLLF